MTRKEAEEYVYRSYLKAEPFMNYLDTDEKKRHPELSEPIIKRLAEQKQDWHNIVITGSKGKGSMACMIAAVLGCRFRVGRMTSPHLTDFRERITVNGMMIPEQDFITQMEWTKTQFEPVEQELLEDVAISPMGIQTVLALHYFLEKQTEYNVLECGKGAAYDDVNNVPHKTAVIGSIFSEHTRELGPDLKHIAENKSAVITGGQDTVYVAKQEEEILKIIEKKARKKQVKLRIYGRDFWSENVKFTKEGMIFDIVADSVRYNHVKIPLLGQHQTENAALAVMLCQDLMPELLPLEAADALGNINWPGRMEVLNGEHLILLDACIHPESCINIKQVLKQLNISKVILAVGIPDDKDYLGVTGAMKELAESIFLLKSQSPHYRFSQEQQQVLERAHVKIEGSYTVSEFMNAIKDIGKPVVILGTTSVVGEVKMWDQGVLQ